MPCDGSMTRAVWAPEGGPATVFDPVTPTAQTQMCGPPQFSGFGSGVVLAEGGIAFHHPDLGWYARYPHGAPPAWLNGHEGTLQLLAGGRGYFGTRRAPGSCARTAEILGPSGQACATLQLDASDGCDDREKLWPDGTLVLHQWGSCRIRWWPGLGRAQ